MEIKLSKLICEWFGHKWRYNFPSLPNRCICKRCKQKNVLNTSILMWMDVDTFEREIRTDKELINKWFR